MININARIISNAVKFNRCGHCLIEAPEIAAIALPGQCINIRISDGFDPLLRRPFGIHRVDKKAARAAVAILYEICGRGTAALSRKKPGEYLDIIGPFGKGFVLRPSTFDLRPVLIAGGIGVAPLVFLAEKLVHSPRLSLPVRQAGGRQAQSAVHRKPVVLIGAKTKKHVLCEKEFKALGCDVKVATEDGSKGFKGRVTGLFASFLSSAFDLRASTIFSCGPRPMLAEVSRVAEREGIPAQVSLEEHMSCGIGACAGCVVETRDGFKRVCKEGPVFDAQDIVW